jgi:hypothetical protein
VHYAGCSCIVIPRSAKRTRTKCPLVLARDHYVADFANARSDENMLVELSAPAEDSRRGEKVQRLIHFLRFLLGQGQ